MCSLLCSVSNFIIYKWRFVNDGLEKRTGRPKSRVGLCLGVGVPLALIQVHSSDLSELLQCFAIDNSTIPIASVWLGGVVVRALDL